MANRIFKMKILYTLSILVFLLGFPEGMNKCFEIKRVITSEQLQAAGITRIADIFFLIDQWNKTTMDGYTWLINPDGPTNFQHNNVIVLIDGKEYNLTTFDIQHFNMLPVTINQIDSIEIFYTPAIEQGEFIDNGMIHFHTRNILAVSSLQFEYLGGNVTGEAGPYEGTKYSSHDLQRIGEDYALSFKYGFGNKTIQSWIIQQQHPFMDAALSRRCYHILEPPVGQKRLSPGLWFDKTKNPKMQRLSLSLKFSWKKFELQSDYAYSFKYFLFFKPVGQEIPVNYIYYHTGLNGTFLNNINYRFGFLSKTLEKHPNALDFDFNWQILQLYGNLNKNFKFYNYHATIGFGFDRFRLSYNKKVNGLYKLYTVIDHHFNPHFYQYIGMMLSIENNTPIFKGTLNYSFILNPGHQFSLYLAYSKNSPATENNIRYWTGRSYNLLDRYHISHNYNITPENVDVSTFGIEWKYNLISDMELIVTNTYKIYHDLYMETQYFRLDTTGYSFTAPIESKNGLHGQTFKHSVEIVYRQPSDFMHKLFYGYQKAVDGDQTFMESWETLSRHKVGYQIFFRPLADFSLWAKLSYLSAVFWTEYQYITGTVYYQSFKRNYYYSASIKSTVTIDFQIQKWFWSRKLVTKFLLKNITNTELRYHPIGSTFGLTYYIQLGIYL